ncbi:CPBP family intramembrane glutamic endopeptidase [Cognatishimia maritima]|uniref:CAAX prenyl protease 2/Lysostaphin resistance protein A-like domain-containing protein n=1 Tax=Cognatishimia maritima TaxID=870908 RepID=A0A1M5NK01_9RHOB|nr:CPBP family intramembrane glutamic endopeptidase [Cognatishimia maritima]SHG89832.1 hypothetical protein SAMN04488044_1563 [Cognatishimia maritima]
MTAYEPHQTLVAPAKASAGLFRLVAGLILLLISVIALNFSLVGVLQSSADWERLQYELMVGNSPRAMLIMLFSFVMAAASLWVVVRLLHRRAFLSLVGPLGATVSDFFRVFRLLIVLSAVLLVLPSTPEQSPGTHMRFAEWLPWVLPALLAIFIQVSTEEVIFRGYFQSQLAARFAQPWVWIVVPSVIFGLLHYSPEAYGENAMLIALWAVAFGCVAADITARSGNLGPAIALHFVNNVLAIMIVALRDHWDGLALLNMPYGPQDTDLVRATLLIEGPVLLCFWLTARIAIRR